MRGLPRGRKSPPISSCQPGHRSQELQHEGDGELGDRVRGGGGTFSTAMPSSSAACIDVFQPYAGHADHGAFGRLKGRCR